MNYHAIENLARRRVDPKMNYSPGDYVYLPRGWREGAPSGTLTKAERDRNERLMKIASRRPWTIKEIRHMGRNVYHVLQQRDIIDPVTGDIFTWTTFHNPPTKDVLDRGFQEYINHLDAEERAMQEKRRKEIFEKEAGEQISEFARKSPDLEAWSKLNCSTVEDCQKIINHIFKFLEDYPPIRQRLYKSLEGKMRFRMKNSRKPRKKSKTKRKSRKPRKKSKKPKRKSRKPRKKSKKPKRKSRFRMISQKKKNKIPDENACDVVRLRDSRNEWRTAAHKCFSERKKYLKKITKLEREIRQHQRSSSKVDDSQRQKWNRPPFF